MTISMYNWLPGSCSSSSSAKAALTLMKILSDSSGDSQYLATVSGSRPLAAWSPLVKKSVAPARVRYIFLHTLMQCMGGGIYFDFFCSVQWPIQIKSTSVKASLSCPYTVRISAGRYSNCLCPCFPKFRKIFCRLLSKKIVGIIYV